jgi:DNA-binding XRE family transcriptional regulator
MDKQSSKHPELKTYTLSEVEDEIIGKTGTPERDKYEFDLKLEILGAMIKTARKERKLTQEELGKLIGVQKAQISKLEKRANNVTIETVLRVFNALKAKVKFRVELQQNAV